jgi:outer membrane protein TolC
VEQVRETYFNLFYLRKMLDSLHETQANLDRIAQTTEAQYHVAMAQQQDVLKAQLQQTNVLKDLEMNQQEFQQGQANLKAFLGREQDSANIEIGDITPTSIAITDSRLRELALANSPTLQQAHAMEDRSDAALAIARRDYIPDFNIAYTYQKTGPRFRDYYMLTLGVKVPLYFWRKQTPAVEQAALEKESVREESHPQALHRGSAPTSRGNAHFRHCRLPGGKSRFSDSAQRGDRPSAPETRVLPHAGRPRDRGGKDT